MMRFAYKNALTVEEATSWLSRYGARAWIMAGGTDVLGKLKDDFLPGRPEAIINIKNIPGLNCVAEEDGVLKIGALTKLHDIANHPVIKARYPALAMAAERTASPNIRRMGTIGGNICQDVRCWYYRNPNNRFPCLRKGGGRCYAIDGDNRYHSIFGGSVEGGCYAVHPSDTAPALIALEAAIRTSKRTVKAEDFFQVAVRGATILDPDEIVTQIDIPAPRENSKSTFIKFAIRSSIDFPIVNCAARIESSGQVVESSRICLNAVYTKPYRAIGAEETILNKHIDDATARSAGDAAVAEARPLKYNRYMVQIARSLVTSSILACR